MRCTFCSEDIAPGKGFMYVKTDGKTFHFCSSKCQKNQIKLKRKPRKVKWVKKNL